MNFFGKWLLLFILLSSQTVIAESTDIKFLHLDVAEGLSQGSVFAINQDYKGLIWIGTRDGLNKYDARKFTVYRNNPKDSASLSDNFIQSIKEDSQKRLWIGTGNGLNLYNRALNSFTRIPLTHIATASSSAEPSVHVITEDHYGQIWIGTNQGLYLIKKGGKITAELIFNTFQFDRRGEKMLFKNVRYIYEDSKQHLWFCTDGGVLEATYRPEQQQKLAIINAYPTDKSNFKNNQATAIAEVDDHLFWIATKNAGIIVLNKKNGKKDYLLHDDENPNSLPSNDIRSIVKDRLGRLWVGTFNGLSVYERGEFKTFFAKDNDQYSLSNNSIRPIFQDKRGSIWVGTYFGGVSIIDADIPGFKNFNHKPKENSLSYNVVSSFKEDKQGNLWIGTEGGGINYLDVNSNRFTYYKHDPFDTQSLTHNNVKSLCIDHEGSLWVGTYEGGLDVKRKGKNYFEHFKNDYQDGKSLSDNSIYALLEDRERNLWVGTFGGGLNLKNKGSNQFVRYTVENKQLSSNSVRVIYEDTKGNLWVGTQNGLNLKRQGQHRFEFFTAKHGDPKAISGNAITSIIEDHQHRIWVGTYIDGLNLYHSEDNSFTHFNEADGLPGNNIFGILEDKSHNLWLSTNAGISRFNPITKTVRNYNTIDGLVGDEFIYGASGKLSNGDMVFGSSLGFTRFSPDSIRINSYEPPVIFTDLKLFNKKVSPSGEGILQKDISLTKKLVLNHKQHVFSIDFTVLNYIHSDKNKYAYKLDGFDEDWNYVSTPSATYTNLDPGRYKFIVKGSNNDGVWSKKTAMLTIQILPPPWKTWWAYLSYLMVGSLALYLLVRFLKTKNKLKQDLLIEHLALEKQREVHEAKLNFFTNISHEFRTPLTLILGPIERLIDDAAMQNHFKPLLNNAQRNANRLLNLVNQLLDFRKQESGNLELHVSQITLKSFLLDTVSSFEYYAQKKQIELFFEQNDLDISLWMDTEQMEKVFANLLYNALKFTPEGGKIRLSVNVQKVSGDGKSFENVAIAIEDTGCGIPEDELVNIFNQFYQSNRYYEDQHIGSGIGLALSESLVKAHGGKVVVKSNLATEHNPYNTCFTVVLPLGNTHFEPVQLGSLISQDNMAYSRETLCMVPDAEAGHDEASQRAAIAKAVILVVEDNTDLRKFVAQGLADKYKVFEACDGLDAWDIIETIQPDIVISDVMMPKCDGITLLEKIKSTTETNHIPVILLTARTAAPYVTNALEKGSDDYITKPFNFEVLRLKVFNILQTRKRFREKFIREYLLQPQKEEQIVKTNTFLEEVIALVELNLTNDDFNVNVLSREVGVSRTVLYRKLKQLTGLNLIEFIKFIRLRKAAQLLKQDNELTISEIAYQVGFSDPKYFSKSFKTLYKMSPKEYTNI